MSKIKRFPAEVSVGDKVQICPNWLRVEKRYRKSDACTVVTGLMNTMLVDEVADIRVSITLWATLLGYTYTVMDISNHGELLELHCEESCRTIWVSRLLIK